MTGDALIAEGRRLARPCVHLTLDGEPSSFAAIWRGPGLVPAPEGSVPAPEAEYEHWITVDCRFLPDEGLGPPSGCLSVYTASFAGAVAFDPSATLSERSGGRALYAHQTLSLPPLEAVFLFGSSAVKSWLAELGWEPEWGWNSNFPAAKVVDDYVEAEGASMPLHGDRVFALLGGWHLPWPEGDWVELLKSPLVVMTLAESEPWVEVFRTGDNYKVVVRIT